MNQLGKMYCYLWEEQDKPGECKFGERFVKPGQDPLLECERRIRDSLGVRKDIFDTGGIRVVGIWDVSSYAQGAGKNRVNARVDDDLRAQIGFRKGTTGEVHTLSGDDMAARVNQLLSKLSQPLPTAHLSRPQVDELLETRRLFDDGHQVVLAELCARFGKTIWAGALSLEMGTQLTIVATYVQTVTTSFMKDLTSFSQWRNHVHVDTKDPDYQERISQALAEGRPVFAYLSACQGDLREERVSWLQSQQVSKLLVVDEADFGVHQKGQVDALYPFRVDPQCRVLLMTGTNGDRAARHWNPTGMTSVTYPELLVAKRNTPERPGDPEPVEGLDHFRVDARRHRLYADVALYQADLGSAVNLAIQRDPDLRDELLDEKRDHLPSWSKTAANPIRAKGFLVAMLQAMFLGKGGLDDLNSDLQFDRTGPRVRMMFLPGSTRNRNMDAITEIAREALPNWQVVALYGNVTSNRRAERVAKEAVERARQDGSSLLILSAGMAQRSFSVGEIEELYLAYDSGDIGATTQKLSRVLTPHEENKVGRVISLSFDPNRDDKFDAVMLETARNLARKAGSDINASLKAVFSSVDLFRFSEDGAVDIDTDTYLREVLDQRRISRVIGATADLALLDEELMLAVATGNAEVIRLERQEAAAKGKTYRPAPPRDREPKDPDQERPDITSKTIQRVREVITTIVENSDILLYGTGSDTVQSAIRAVQECEIMQRAVAQQFGLEFDLVAFLFESGVINTHLVDLMHRKSV